ncbi:MAG: PD40 domain-containing protein, partial [Calditrichaeota bacterium]|nr:PD40 domain-containing protein [Calditrichota bacterium]
FKDAVGKSLDKIYQDWYNEKQATYIQATLAIKKSAKPGKKLWSEGEGNFYPTYSPDGKWIAFTSSANSRSMAMNALYLLNRQTGEVEKTIKFISSQISWLPDGSGLIYSKQSEATSSGSHYNDLYRYDVGSENETRLTYGLRARNAAINSKNQIVFVTTYDGTSNLMSFELDNQLQLYSVDYEKLELQAGETAGYQVRGKNLRFITGKNDFSQYFHPVFKDDQTILVDYARGYQRSIVELNLTTGGQNTVLSGAADYRNPFYLNGRLYYASDETGIFNIYEMDQTGNSKPLTNVLGAAFMPSVHNGDLVYSLYDSLSFNIAEVKQFNSLESDDLNYENRSDFRKQVPQAKPLTFTIDPDTISYGRTRNQFKSYYFIPRLFVDDERPKFGGIFLVNELLDRIQMFFGAAANFKGERDIFSIIEYRNLSLFGADPILFFEGYNQTTQITDPFELKYDLNNQYFRADRDVEFVLWQFEFGWKIKLWNSLDWRFAYIISKYQAQISPIVTNSVYSNGSYVFFEFPFLRYDYHKGKAFENRFLFELNDPSSIGQIVPREGFRLFTNISYNKNEFLDGFGFNTTGVEEVYKPYNYWYAKVDFRFHLPALTKNSGISIRLATEGNFSKTDDFYDVYAGGWIGLKGYPYFSIHGRQGVFASITYNQLLFRDIGWSFLKLHLKHMSIATFFETGDAWRGNNFNLKRDIGFQFKVDTYEELKLFFEGAYPLNQVSVTTQSPDQKDIQVIYKADWRFYFGINYDFELLDIL